MLLLFSGEGATDIGKANYGHDGLCAPEQWAPGPMAHLACEVLQHFKPSVHPWIDAAYFIDKSDLDKLSKVFKPHIVGGGKNLFHSRMARTMGCVARYLAAKHNKKVIPVFFRDGSGSGKFSEHECNEIRASINGEKQGFQQLFIQTGVAMVPRPVSEVWLLCALKKDSYISCKKLENLPAKDANNHCPPKDELEKCLASRKLEQSDLPDLIQSRGIDCEKIKMPSYDCFFENMQNAVKNCVEDDWCLPLPKTLQGSCDRAIESCRAWF